MTLEKILVDLSHRDKAQLRRRIEELEAEIPSSLEEFEEIEKEIQRLLDMLR